MPRAQVDPEKAAAAVADVREGSMSFRRAVETFAVSVGSIQKRSKDELSVVSRLMQTKSLTREKKAVLVDTLL